jgi:superfamily II DNA or RNA helicase
LLAAVDLVGDRTAGEGIVVDPWGTDTKPPTVVAIQGIKDAKIEITKLSTVMQLNEGVNIPNLKQGIIMHAYGNERKAAQRIGRLLRLNPDDKAIVHILCYMDTVDEKWVKEALEGFDQTKIIWKDFNISLY